MNETINKLLYGIKASSVERYLLLNGWERDFRFKNPNLISFIHNVSDKRIAISAKESYQDFYMTLYSALQTVVMIHDKSLGEIVKEISNVHFDKMEFRIISEFTKNGKIPLKYASACIDGLKNLILYSACAEQDAQPICFKATNSAKEYLESFNFAQTDVGSFVINIDIQVVEDDHEQYVVSGYERSPFEHKVVERIYKAINQVNDVVEHKLKISEVAEDAYITGMTANMCDALLKLKPESGEAEISTTLRFATALNNINETSKKIVIGNNHFWAIDELSKIYKNKTLYENVVLTGVVKTLSKKDHENITEKTIKLLSRYDNKLRTIIMELSDEHHLIACDAYKNDLEVEVSGELDMSNKNWVINKISSFRII